MSSRTLSLLLTFVCCVALCMAGLAATVQAQVPADCPNVCTHRYALCIAASCDEDGNCGECDATDGSCGYCYVFPGESCSYDTSCDELRPSGDTVYSTYSEVLTNVFDFKVMTCGSPSATADCMDAKCKLTGDTVTLPLGHAGELVDAVPTAICECRITEVPGGSTEGGDCNADNCSATWSTASVEFLSGQPQCEDCG